MKKVFTKLFVVLAAVTMLTGCGKDSTISIGFRVLPKDQYDVTEDEHTIKNRIIVNVNGSDYTLNEIESMGAKISGLDFSNLGKHTLIIEYGNNTISYDYEVVGDNVITTFEKAFENINLDSANDGYVFGFDYKTGEVGLYNKLTNQRFGSSKTATNDVYFVASCEDDFSSNSLNGYVIVDDIKLSDTLVLNHPVDIIATKDSNAISGDIKLESNDDVNVKIDANIYGTLTIDCPNGHIEHYGQANEVVVEAASEHTYVENGVVANLKVADKADNIEISEKGIVYNLDMTNASNDNKITNNGIIYRYTGNHAITNNGFIYQDAICSTSTEYNLPLASGKVTIENYKVVSASFDIGTADQLMWFSSLTQSGKSPLIQDQPLVSVEITDDIDLSAKEWIPIANWNLWANGVAGRWFTGNAQNEVELSGWESYCKGIYTTNNSSTPTYGFIGTDEMYCKAFYNDNYTYNGAKIDPIYFIRLELDGNSKTISNINNAFLGCLSYDSNIHDLTLNFNAESGTDKATENLIWNNLNGINMKGFLDPNVNTHFGLMCNNIYIPETTTGAPSGTVAFTNITIGGKFIYRNCSFGAIPNGDFVAGAFLSNICGKGNNNGEAVLKFSQVALDENLEFLITQRDSQGTEYVKQWGSAQFTYDPNNKTTNSCNYALLADYCCGTNGGSPSTYSNLEYDIDAFNSIGAQIVKKVSNYQGGYYGDTHDCKKSKNSLEIVWEADCDSPSVSRHICATCGCAIANDTYVIGDDVQHSCDLKTYKQVTSNSDLEDGGIYYISVQNGDNNQAMGTIYNTYIGGKINNSYKLSNGTLLVKLIKVSNDPTYALQIADANLGNGVDAKEGLYISATSGSSTLNKKTVSYESDYTKVASKFTISIDSTTHNASISSATSNDYKILGAYIDGDNVKFYVYNETGAAGSDFNAIKMYKLQDYVVPKAPTCTETGSLGYHYCSECNKYFDYSGTEITTGIIPATGHTYGEAVWTHNDDRSKYTCTIECTVCHHKETATDAPTVVGTATCTESGTMQYSCNCTIEGKEYDYSENIGETAKLGHYYIIKDSSGNVESYTREITQWPSIDGDTKVKGTLTSTCTRCGEKATDDLYLYTVKEALGMDARDTIIVVKGVVVGYAYNRSTNELLIQDKDDKDSIISLRSINSAVMTTGGLRDLNYVEIGDEIYMPCKIITVSNTTENHADIGKKALYSATKECGLQWHQTKPSVDTTKVNSDLIISTDNEPTAQLSTSIEVNEDNYETVLTKQNLYSNFYKSYKFTGTFYLNQYNATTSTYVDIRISFTKDKSKASDYKIDGRYITFQGENLKINFDNDDFAKTVFGLDNISTTVSSPTEFTGTIYCIYSGGKDDYCVFNIISLEDVINENIFTYHDNDGHAVGTMAGTKVGDLKGHTNVKTTTTVATLTTKEIYKNTCSVCGHVHADLEGDILTISGTITKGHFELVTSANQLADNDYVILVDSSDTLIYKSGQKATEGVSTEFVKDDDKIVYSKNYGVFKLIKSGTKYAFNYVDNSAKYIYATGARMGFGLGSSASSDSSLFTISFDSNNAKITNGKAYLVYGAKDASKNDIFGAVSTDTANIHIYKYVMSENAVVVRTDNSNGALAMNLYYNEISGKYYNALGVEYVQKYILTSNETAYQLNDNIIIADATRTHLLTTGNSGKTTVEVSNLGESFNVSTSSNLKYQQFILTSPTNGKSGYFKLSKAASNYFVFASSTSENEGTIAYTTDTSNVKTCSFAVSTDENGLTQINSEYGRKVQYDSSIKIVAKTSAYTDDNSLSVYILCYEAVTTQ